MKRPNARWNGWFVDRREEIVQLCRILSLAYDNSKARDLAEEVQRGSIDWERLVEVANLNLLTPALYAVLRDHNLLDLLDDSRLTGFLSEVYELNRRRNEDILLQLQDIESTLDEEGISALFLKGSAVLSENLYPDIGMRMMNDIDLMISQERFDRALKLLKKSGYEEFGRDLGRWHHHTPRMAKEGFPAALEPHFRIVSDPNIEYIPYTKTTSVPSVNPSFRRSYVLKPKWHLYHAFLHTSIVDRNHKKWRLGLRYLYDFVLLAKAYSERVEWSEIYELAKRYGHEKVLEDFLYCAEALFGLKTPIKVNRFRGWLHLKKSLWQSTLQTDTRIFKIYRAYTELDEIYSYKALESFYGLKSKSEYPLALLRYIVYHIRKHLF